MSSDQRLILILASVMLVLIVGVSLLSPEQQGDDPTPVSTNSGPLGTEAAYLTLQGLGHRTSRWTQPLAAFNTALSDEQAAHTTLVLIAPVFDATEEAALKAEAKKFMERGGRIVTTGAQGASLLGGKVTTSLLDSGLCHTTPQGDTALSRAGKVEFSDHGGWQMDNKQFAGDNLTIAQNCGKDAVVVSFTEPGTAGKGGAVWWTSAEPFANTELKQDPALKLILASVGDRRDVVFDEAMHVLTRTQWDTTKGLPILWISLQIAALFLLLVFSYSRRRGPVRMPVTLPRSSPVEFATSMGDLYEKGGATGAATEAARRRLLRVLTADLGIAPQVVKAGPDAIAEAVQRRLGAASQGLAARIAQHLGEADEAQHTKVSAKSALTLVRGLSDDAEALQAAVMPAANKKTAPGEFAVATMKETR